MRRIIQPVYLEPQFYSKLGRGSRGRDKERVHLTGTLKPFM